jgi:hypothetical protein
MAGPAQPHSGFRPLPIVAERAVLGYRSQLHPHDSEFVKLIAFHNAFDRNIKANFGVLDLLSGARGAANCVMRVRNA